MIFVDTGYLIGLVDKNDDLHETAMRWDAVVTNDLLLTEFVLLETVNHFSAPAVRGKIHSMIGFIRTNSEYTILPASTDLFEIGLDLHRRRPDQNWSLTDCISFHIMRDRGITHALAFDHHFVQAGFTALLRSDPPTP